MYAPAGLNDLVVYFFRRIFSLIRPSGFASLITTNSIKDGDVRKGGLDQILASGGEIVMATRAATWPGRAKVIVSLVSIHKGVWTSSRWLDGTQASYISSFFEGEADIGEPKLLAESQKQVFTGYYWLGDGFLISHEQADALISQDPRNADVVFRVINGQELNNVPNQQPPRSIINFHDWSESRARTYVEPFGIIELLVKPFRANRNRERNKELWWQYAENRPGLTRKLRPLQRCFATANTTKYLSFSAIPTTWLASHPQNVFTTDRWDLYAVVQSTIHEVWARKYSGALKQDLRYSPSKCFDTFPFPEELWRIADPDLAALGERYHEHRRALMLRLWLGLTDIYNLFHDRDLSPELITKKSKKPAEANAGYQGILELRALHKALDEAILAAYGWSAKVSLDHDFHEVETLPENDRVRYTISPAARKELLKRLLAENHARAAAEAEAIAVTAATKPKRGRKKGATVDTSADIGLFMAMSYPSSDADQAVCAAALSTIEQTEQITSMDHLDVVLLATHPQWCNAFLTATEQKQLAAAVAKAPASMFVEVGQSIRWKDARDHLEQRGAIKVDHSSTAQPIAGTDALVTIKATFPRGVDGIVALALKAVDRVRSIRAKAITATQEQEQILAKFRQEAKSSGLAVA